MSKDSGPALLDLCRLLCIGYLISVRPSLEFLLTALYTEKQLYICDACESKMLLRCTHCDRPYKQPTWYYGAHAGLFRILIQLCPSLKLQLTNLSLCCSTNSRQLPLQHLHCTQSRTHSIRSQPTAHLPAHARPMRSQAAIRCQSRRAFSRRAYGCFRANGLGADRQGWESRRDSWSD